MATNLNDIVPESDDPLWGMDAYDAEKEVEQELLNIFRNPLKEGLAPELIPLLEAMMGSGVSEEKLAQRKPDLKLKILDLNFRKIKNFDFG